MVTLHEVLKQAETEGVAVGHFNVSDLVTLKAVFESARDQNVPVIVGVSEGERQFLGVRQISIWSRAYARNTVSRFLERRSYSLSGKRHGSRESGI
jgi:fructose/tagatose bisphosphate aldolase